MTNIRDVTPIGVSLGLFPQYSLVEKFGRNANIGTGTAPEDVYAAGDDYTGFDATADENIEVFSSDANDQGTEVSSGTATGGSATTLIDTGATFVTDGAVAGDLLINDTQAIHGIITSVDSETQITVFNMVGPNEALTYANAASDAYRIANANDTGVAVVKLTQLLNAVFAQQTDRYVILNGVTGVTVTGTYARCTRVQVILAGSTGTNEGTITVRQATTTANVFAVMPIGDNQTQICAYTVPAGKIAYIVRIRAEIARANGSAGSAVMSLRIRRYGEVFRAVPSFDVTDSAPVDTQVEGLGPLPPGTDIKIRVDSVSDNNTSANGKIELILADQ